MDYLLLIIGWVTYGALHSLLASHRSKNTLQSWIPGLAPYYRISYNIFAILSLFLLLYLQSHIERLLLIEPNSVLFWTGAGMVVIGLGIILLALQQYNLSEFSGLDAFKKHKNKGSKLAIHGLSGKVRHPLYTGTLLVLWGLWVYDSTLSGLIMALFLSGYIRIGIYFEEQKLIREFGEEYKNYQKQVPMLFPTILQ